MSVGFPSCLWLNQWAHAARQVYGGDFYLVGSALTQKNTRDVDVVCLLADDVFEEMFGSIHASDFDWKWSGLCCAFSAWAKEATGLNIDFKFQPITLANEKHDKPRGFLGGMYLSDPRKAEFERADPSTYLIERAPKAQPSTKHDISE